MWGNPSSYIRLWRATANGLEGLAALHNDGLLILDELSLIDPREAGEAAYLLANEQGKARASRAGTARPSAKWRLLFLSSGEESLAALMARSGRKANAGQETVIRKREIADSLRVVVGDRNKEAILVRNPGGNGWVLNGWNVKTPDAVQKANDVKKATPFAADSSDSKRIAGGASRTVSTM